MYVYTPIEYYMLMEWDKSVPKTRKGKNYITYNQINTLALCSDNDMFRTAAFRRALIDFRRFGLRPSRKRSWTVRDAVYYAKNSYLAHETIKHCALA